MSDKFPEINSLGKALERLESMQAELTEAQAKAARVDAVEAALVKLGIDPTAHATPEALAGEVRSVSARLGSAKAMQITASLGMDPLPISGGQPGTPASGGEERTGRDRWARLDNK